MPMKSDITVDPSKFDPLNVSEKTKKFNEDLIEIGKQNPRWYEVLLRRFFLLIT